MSFATVAAPAAAAAGWQAPEYLSGFAQGGSDVRLAGSGSGRAVAVWVGSSYKIWARVYEPGDGWGHLSNIGEGSNPQAVISDLGVATVVWNGGTYGDSYVAASHFTREAGWSDAVIVGDGGQRGNPFLVAGSAAGGVFAVWPAVVAGNATLNSSLYLPGRGWDAPQTIRRVPGGLPAMGCAAIDDLGRGYIGWTVSDGFNQTLIASTSDFGSLYGYATRINPGNSVAFDCAFAKNGSKGITLAYSATEPPTGELRVNACTFWAAECSGVQVVATPADYGGGLAAASDGAGHRALAWFSKPAPSNASRYGTWVAYADPGSDFAAPQTVGPDIGLSSIASDYGPRIDMDEGGRAVVVVAAIRARPGGGAGILGVGANRYTPGVGWGAFEDLAGNETSDCGETAAAATRGGVAFAAWRCWGPSVPQDMFVRRFAAPPALVLTAPVEGQAVASQAVLVTGSTDSAARLSVNGVAVAVSSAGAFSVILEIAPGNQTITATSTLPQGDSAVVSVNITVPDIPADAIAEIAAVQSALENATARLDATEAALAAAEAARASAEANITILRASENASAEALAAARADLDAANATVAALQSQAAVDRAALDQQRTALLAARADIAALQSSGNASAERIAALERALAGTQAALTAANASLAASDAPARSSDAAAGGASQAAGLALLVAVVALSVAVMGILMALRARNRHDPER